MPAVEFEASGETPLAETTQNEAPEAEESGRPMRSMMFGEEFAASAQPVESPLPDTASEQTDAAEVPAAEGEQVASAAAQTWPGNPWEEREEETSSVEPEQSPQPEAEAANLTQNASEAEQPAPAMWGTPIEFNPWKTDEAKVEAEPEAQPAAEISPEEIAIPAAPAGTESDKAPIATMVIIEDDQTAASYYATLFRGNGYQVEVANDGVSGVDLCVKMQPQVILLDVMMPRQNGILVLQTLRASDETKNTPVVVMSNFSEPTLIKRALQLGALEYVIKTQVEGPALLNALPHWINREKAFAAA